MIEGKQNDELEHAVLEELIKLEDIVDFKGNPFNCQLVLRLYYIFSLIIFLKKYSFSCRKWSRKKTECEHKEMRQQELIKNICHFKSRRDLYFFLMNTLLQFKYDGW